jgi:hypothetical protein
VGGQRHALAAFTPERYTIPTVRVPGPVWAIAENLATTGIRSPDRPARSVSLYSLISPGPQSLEHMSTFTLRSYRRYRTAAGFQQWNISTRKTNTFPERLINYLEIGLASCYWSFRHGVRITASVIIRTTHRAFLLLGKRALQSGWCRRLSLPQSCRPLYGANSRVTKRFLYYQIHRSMYKIRSSIHFFFSGRTGVTKLAKIFVL